MLERAWLYRRFNADQQGQFSLSGIAPGKYRLFAVVPQDKGAESDPEWLRIHHARGIRSRWRERYLQLKLKRTSVPNWPKMNVRRDGDAEAYCAHLDGRTMRVAQTASPAR